MNNFKISFVFEPIACMASHNLSLGKCKLDPDKFGKLSFDEQCKVIAHEAVHAFVAAREGL